MFVSFMLLDSMPVDLMPVDLMPVDLMLVDLMLGDRAAKPVTDRENRSAPALLHCL